MVADAMGPTSTRCIGSPDRPSLSILTVQQRSDGVGPGGQDSHDADIMNPLLRRCVPPAQEKRRNIVGFWLMGFLTNVT